MAALSTTQLPLCIAMAVLVSSGHDALHSCAPLCGAHAPITRVQVEALLCSVLAVAKPKATLGAKAAVEKLGTLHDIGWCVREVVANMRVCNMCTALCVHIYLCTQILWYLDVADGALAPRTRRRGHLVVKMRQEI